MSRRLWQNVMHFEKLLRTRALLKVHSIKRKKKSNN